MPVRDQAWPQGTPCWVDCQLDAPAKGSEFYRELFGWDIVEAGPETGGYRMANINGRPAAGLMGKPPGVTASVWTTYFAADNVDDVQTKITAAGGTVLTPAMDVMDAGRMLVAKDSSGATFGVWEARNHIGANVYNEHGAYVWNDLHTKDHGGAQTFYNAVFGWTYRDVGDSSTMTYSVFTVPGGTAGVGGIGLDTSRPDDLPNYWLTWFRADQVDRMIAQVTALGGSVLMPAEDSPFGRMGIVTGAQGEAFGLIETNRRTDT